MVFAEGVRRLTRRLRVADRHLQRQPDLVRGRRWRCCGELRAAGRLRRRSSRAARASRCGRSRTPATRAGIPAQVIGRAARLPAWFGDEPIVDFRSAQRADAGARLRLRPGAARPRRPEGPREVLRLDGAQRRGHRSHHRCDPGRRPRAGAPLGPPDATPSPAAGAGRSPTPIATRSAARFGAGRGRRAAWRGYPAVVGRLSWISSGAGGPGSREHRHVDAGAGAPERGARKGGCDEGIRRAAGGHHRRRHRAWGASWRASSPPRVATWRSATSPRRTMAETKALCARPTRRAEPRVSSFAADVSDEAQVLAFRDAVPRDHDTRPHPPAVQQRRHRRRRQLRDRRARGVGEDLRRVLERRLPLHPRLPAAADGEPRGPPRQHQQRQRLLGDARDR